MQIEDVNDILLFQIQVQSFFGSVGNEHAIGNLSRPVYGIPRPSCLIDPEPLYVHPLALGAQARGLREARILLIDAAQADTVAQKLLVVARGPIRKDPPLLATRGALEGALLLCGLVARIVPPRIGDALLVFRSKALELCGRILRRVRLKAQKIAPRRMPRGAAFRFCSAQPLWG